LKNDSEEIPEEIKEKLDRVSNKGIYKYLRQRKSPHSTLYFSLYVAGWVLVSISVACGFDLDGWEYPLSFGILFLGGAGLAILDILDDVYRIKKKLLK